MFPVARPKPALQKLNLNNVLRWESLREKVTSVQTLGFFSQDKQNVRKLIVTRDSELTI